MIKHKITQSTLDRTFDFGNANDFLTIPDALISYTRNTVFTVWQTMELQLSKVDPVKDPDIYQALNSRTAAIFEIWLGFRGVN